MSEINNYDEKSINILKGIFAVRKRPGMYIGDTDKKGLHHLIYEITDNSVDEALAGYCDEIIIQKHSDNSISIKDNGRGIPVGIHPTHKISAATIIFTELHAGGKFGDGGYKVSGGLHGVGATVTNALSNYLEVTIKRNGKLYFQRFEKGVPLEDLKEIESNEDNSKTGTMVRFQPDETMFPEAMEEDGNIDLSLEYIKNRLKITSYLTKKLKFILLDENGTKKYEFYSENGIIDYLKDLAPKLYKTPVEFNEDKDETMFASDIHFFESDGVYINSFDQSEFNTSVEIAFAYQNKYFDTSIMSFANNIHTAQGGKHVVGFENAFVKFVNEYNIKELKSQDVFTKEDVLEGLNAIISFKTEEPKFSDQTKQKLATGAAQKLCYKATKDFLEQLFETNPDFATYLITKSQSAKKMREQMDKKRNEIQKNVSTNIGGTAKKLTDCSIRIQAGTELFLVEGDSAGGAAKQGRDRKFQAILPLKGKILNAIKNDNKKVENSDEVKNLRLALKTGTDESFNIDKLRYEKIIIMCDADVDGAHIETLILTYFMEKMPQLIENGHVYLAQPPLYVLKNTSGGAKVKSFYIQNDEELEKYYVDGKLPKNLQKQRFKGLGEMNSDQLWETTMNPETRKLIRVTLDTNKLEETSKIFNDLMGKRVEPRRNYIFENAINIEIDY